MRNDYLSHHGILGQKWGMRNGPPYPLGAGDHSAAEKKAGYKKSIGGGRNEDLYDRHKQMKDMYDKTSPGKFQLKPAKKPGSLSKALDSSGGLTEGQKKALKIGAAVAVTALVAYGSYKLATNPKVQDAVRKGLSKVKGGSLNNTLKAPAAWVDDNIRLAKSQGIDLGKGWDTDFFKTPQGPKPSADQTLNNLYKHWDAKNAAEKSANRGLSEAQKIISNANKISGRDQIKKAATSIDSSDISRIKALRSSGKSVDEVAKMLGISPSSVSMYTDDAAKAAAKTTDEIIKKYASSPEHAKSLMKTRDRLKAMQDVDDYTQELLKKNAAKLKRIK